MTHRDEVFGETGQSCPATRGPVSIGDESDSRHCHGSIRWQVIEELEALSLRRVTVMHDNNDYLYLR